MELTEKEIKQLHGEVAVVHTINTKKNYLSTKRVTKHLFWPPSSVPMEKVLLSHLLIFYFKPARRIDHLMLMSLATKT